MKSLDLELALGDIYILYTKGGRKMERILNKIESPKDLKPLSISEMKELAEEIRSALLKKLSIHGGHFGPKDRKSTRLNSSHEIPSRMPSSA